MSPTLKKLGLKDDKEILVLNAPDSFGAELNTIPTTAVLTNVKKAKSIRLALTFVTTEAEVAKHAPLVSKACPGDASVWFAYPKGSSKRYKSEISRDKGFAALGREGFEPVAMIAIDEDWSAKRFRRVEFIKTMTRPDEYRLTKPTS